MGKNLKEILFKERFDFSKEQDDYQFQLKPKRKWWSSLFQKTPEMVDHVDLVMCIDSTGSMASLINMVKANVLHFYSDFMNCCAKRHKEVGEMRMRVIAFGDYNDSTHSDSGLLRLPDEQQQLTDYVNAIQLTGGGDPPEDGLEALALAIKTTWETESKNRRHIIVLYSDAPPHILGKNADCPLYPQGMPKDFKELTRWWKSMDKKARRLVLFAPRTEWAKVAKTWDHVFLESRDLNMVLSGQNYTKIIDAICKSL